MARPRHRHARDAVSPSAPRMLTRTGCWRASPAGGWCPSAIPTLFAACSMSEQLAPSDAPAEVRETFSGYASGFVVALVVAMTVAALGALFGVALLRLREWGRRGLVVLTWLLLL